MGGEVILVDGVAFRPEVEGRELVYLGAVQVGEVMPIYYEGKLARSPLRGTHPDRHTHCFRLCLPGSHASVWTPARDIDVARWQAVRHVKQWLSWAELKR